MYVIINVFPKIYMIIITLGKINHLDYHFGCWLRFVPFLTLTQIKTLRLVFLSLLQNTIAHYN